MKKRILLVDDESDLLEIISYNLEKEGYNVTTAINGKLALKYDLNNFDLFILDVMMPEINGFDLCRKLKTNPVTSNIPIIFLTAKSSEIDEIKGLDIGADDYIIKPVSIKKLIARIKNILQRNKSVLKTSSILIIEGIEIDLNNYSIKINSEVIPFTKKEFESLLSLINNKGKIVTREMLLQTVWGDDVFVGQRTIDVHIRKIREKLKDKAYIIETIKGIGYRIN